MRIRSATEKDYFSLALMKWEHAAEDDTDYGEHNLDGVIKDDFISEFIGFLKVQKEYKIYLAEEDGEPVCAMFVHLIPKLPKPNGNARYIAYLTNVYTKKAYRNQGVGTRLLAEIKQELTAMKCELIFAWLSDHSVRWYQRNGFFGENEIFECPLCEE